MKQRFQNRTQGHRASASGVANARPAAGIIADWKTRRVPLRHFNETRAQQKKVAKSAADSKQRPATSKSKKSGTAFHRILVPVDFSADSTRALKAAAALAKSHDSDLTLVHVVGPIYDLRDFGYARQRLSSLAQKNLEAGLEWRPVVRSGNGPNEILQEAQEMNADVIVISTRGLSHAPPSKIGSIAKRIIRQSSCPVLILPATTKVKPKLRRTKKRQP
jgi:nucleotide-binding universal stress UspA family protein